ncbi:hypothetical protein L1987_13974 [Smallanthus sonchifolius]|uniref:Uncharacterized protein n=1 Tax=Smallanthus sonchifolius TaxID=185202 RepID=A0ACB9JIY3_9ASTR|nr:hypothetical protein L1987_13974 [Smallanthus sonchifolius]
MLPSMDLHVLIINQTYNIIELEKASRRTGYVRAPTVIMLLPTTKLGMQLNLPLKPSYSTCSGSTIIASSKYAYVDEDSVSKDDLVFMMSLFVKSDVFIPGKSTSPSFDPNRVLGMID